MARRRVGLIVLDSVAMLARLEFGTDQVITRQKMLAEQASLLKQVAEQFDIPVVLTNQVTGGGNASGTTGAQRAALGVVWAHAVSTRLVLDQQQHIRWLRVCSIGSDLLHATLLHTEQVVMQFSYLYSLITPTCSDSCFL
jgi:predicted ATP-dependent serine protease